MVYCISTSINVLRDAEAEVRAFSSFHHKKPYKDLGLGGLFAAIAGGVASGTAGVASEAL